jgi:hypothetical protein
MRHGSLRYTHLVVSDRNVCTYQATRIHMVARGQRVDNVCIASLPYTLPSFQRASLEH